MVVDLPDPAHASTTTLFPARIYSKTFLCSSLMGFILLVVYRFLDNHVKDLYVLHDSTYFLDLRVLFLLEAVAVAADAFGTKSLL